MIDEQEDGTDGTGGGLRLARLFARRGCYTEATQHLSETLDEGGCSASEALDLQARIYAQQGMFLNAEACWKKALQMDPDNASYAEALALLRRNQRPFSNGVLISGCTLILCVLASSVIVLSLCTRNERNRFQVMGQRLAALEKSVTALDTRSVAEQETLRSLLPGLPKAEQLASLTTRVDAGQLAASNEWTALRLGLQQLAAAQKKSQEDLRSEATVANTGLQTLTQQLAAREAAHSNAVTSFLHQAGETKDNQQKALLEQQAKTEHLLLSVSKTCDDLKKDMERIQAVQGQTLDRMAKDLEALEATQTKARERDLQRYQTGLFGIIF